METILRNQAFHTISENECFPDNSQIVIFGNMTTNTLGLEGGLGGLIFAKLDLKHYNRFWENVNV